MKTAIAALAALTLTSAHLPDYARTEDGIAPSAHPEVVRVDCLVGSGSAFRVGKHLLASVNHVTSLDGCFVHGHPITIIRHDGDFSIITDGETAKDWLKVDCGGFVKGRKYRAIGFAHGLDTLTEVDLTATGDTDGQFSVLTGVFNVIPGQSGGAIIDADTGRVVGTVNVFDAVRGMSGSVALKGTSLCLS